MAMDEGPKWLCRKASIGLPLVLELAPMGKRWRANGVLPEGANGRLPATDDIRPQGEERGAIVLVPQGRAPIAPRSLSPGEHMTATPSRRPGRKRKAVPVSLPSVLSIAMEQRAQLARARLNAVARPLAYTVTSDGYGGVCVMTRQRTESRPDDRLTPERRRHAEGAELLVVMDTYETDAGEKTQLKRQRLISPLEQLWKAGVIDSGQYGAARRYQRDADIAAVVGPSSTVRYEPRMIEGGERELLPIEAAMIYLERVASAQRACGVKQLRMLEWIANEAIGWRWQARAWFPSASEGWARVSFKRLLRNACDDLERHYRFR
jgi:hypothetical protein